MNAEARSTRLSQEIVRLSDLGWELRERGPYDAVMAMAFHGWSPRRVMLAQAAVSLVTLGFPGVGVRDRERRILISVDGGGAIHRRTISELPPPARRRGREWAEPDTDEPAPVEPSRAADSGDGISAASAEAAPPTPSPRTGPTGSLVA